ncbi:MAG: protein kinase [Acidobacteria bacterium]|nr:protein kinase [Acidobacteriota bacterium]MCA1620433.1 protein kinase [Acidobacteriota bacterium]
MTPERWKQVEGVFDAAMDLAPEERDAYLARACAGDAELRRQVEMLIRSDEQAGAFIEEPAVAGVVGDSARSAVAGAFDAAAFDAGMYGEAAPFIGRRVGSYRIVRELGRGGMGAVYLAVRADDEFQKRVAIKLVKRGMDTDFILRRFRQERQILASLDHTYIARLMDGGTTDDGLPYFVMEYIEGLPVNQFCDAHKLSTPERLRLFLKVCAAVAYAHHNLVIHRDLKPSNVLVTADGAPKLLDFGIAKLLNPEMGGRALDPTTLALRLMTPEYASPEQVRGETVTMVSDVYSLGVLLYDLLTGHRPYNLRNRSPEEMARVICEQEPERPSVAVNLIEVIPAAGRDPVEITPDSVSRVRDGSLEKLRRQLSGSIDNIVLKALRKEQQRRYQSVDEFARDIEHYLEGRPVGAPSYFPATAETRIGDAEPAAPAGKSIAVLPFKTLSHEENRDEFLGMGMADAIITKLSNVGGVVVRPTSSVIKYFDGEQSAALAGHELDVAYVLDGRIQRVGQRVRVTVQLVRTRDAAPLWAGKFDEQFTDFFAVEDSVSEKVAQALLPHLMGDEAARDARDNSDGRARSDGAAAPARDPGVSTGDPLKSRTTVPTQGQPSQAIHVTPTTTGPRLTEDEEAHQLYVAGRYFATRRTAEGLRQAVERLERAVKRDPRFAMAWSELADCYALMNWYVEPPPEGAWERAVAAALRAVEADDALAEAHASLGFVKLYYERDWEGAERELGRAVQLKPESAVARRWHAFNLSARGRHDEAVAEIRRAEEVSPRSPVVATGVANVLFLAGRFDDAIGQCRRALELDPGSMSTHIVLRWCHEMQGACDDALAVYEQERAFAGDTPTTRAKYAHVLASCGDAAEARATLAELTGKGEARGALAYEVAVVYSLLGERDEAFEWLERAAEEHAVGLAFVRVDPRLRALGDDPRFDALLRRIGSWEAPHLTDAGARATHTTPSARAASKDVTAVAPQVDESAARANVSAGAVAASPRVEAAAAVTPSAASVTASTRRGRRVWLAASVALAALLVAGLCFWHFGLLQRRGVAGDAFQRASAAKITSSGNVRRAALSPDGKIVAYVIDEAGKQGLWVRQVAVSNSVRLVPPSDAYYRNLTFSRDGTYIYYTVASKEGGGFDLYQVPWLGGSVKLIRRGVGGSVGVSHDGRRLAYFVADASKGRETMYVAGEDGTGERAVAARDYPEHFSAAAAPAFSPDGERLAFVVETADANGFFLKALEVGLEGGGERQLSPGKRWSDVGQLRWLADGSGLLLSAMDETISMRQLWRVGYPGGEAVRLTNDLTDYGDLSLSDDALSLASVQSQTLTTIFLAQAGDYERRAQITSGAGRYVDLSWTPDGRVLFASDASGNADIWEMAADGSGQVQLTAGAGRNYAPVSSPDGRYVLFHSNRSGAWQIWRMDRDGSNPVRLTAGDENSNWPQVTRDGRWVVYEHAGEGSQTSLWRVPIGGGEPERLTRNLSMRPSVSPDGRHVAYWHKEERPGAPWGIAVIPAAGGGPARVLEVPQNEANGMSSIHWTTDARAFVYTDYRDGVTNLRRQPLEGGEARQITNYTREIFYSFDLSREGRLLLANGLTTSDVVILRDSR